ncbi:hypothetical protein ACFL7M_14905, partial [Thermodesulfobacteriota bacterium]
MFNNMLIKTRLLISFLAVGIMPFAIMGITSLTKSSEALQGQAFEKLKIVQEIKKAQIEEFIQKCRSDITVLSKNPLVSTAIDKFAMSFDFDGNIKEEAFGYFDQQFELGQFIKEYGY